MDEIFRFLFLRPPAPGTPVTVRPSLEFAKDLAAADGAQDRKAALKLAAAKLVSSPRGITNLTDLGMGAALLATQTALAKLEDPTSDQVSAAVQTAFGNPPAQVANAQEFAKDRDRLSDNLLAAKLLSRDESVEARQIEALLRLMEIIQRVAIDDAALKDPGAVLAALEKPTFIGAAAATPRRDKRKDRPPTSPPDLKPELQKLRDRIKALQGVATTLTRIEPRAFLIPQKKPVSVPESAPAIVDVLRANLVSAIRSGEIERITAGSIRAVVGELQAVQSASITLGPALPAANRLVLTSEAAQALPEEHRATLRSLDLDVTKKPLPAALTVVRSELTSLHTDLASLEEAGTQVSLFGSHLYEMQKVLGKVDSSWLDFAPGVPATHGTIQPVGIGDLLIVRQQLKRYEGGEIGYIENILKGESKKREVDRERTTEETTITEAETQKEEERDNQTTERFELQREASQVIKDDSSFKAGLSVSGSYGPTIEFKASTDFAMNHAKEESAKSATNYSKEVTSRASSKVTERTRTEHILRTVEVFKEKDEHGVDNSKGDGPVIGVYQWVDKIYEAQVFNYGKRMMFDVMVPEPAAFWIYANTNKPKAGATLTKPDPFTLTPDQIDETNYTLYVKKYQVSGVKPPPEPYQTVSKSFEGTSPHDDHSGTKVSEVPIPDGFQAITGSAIAANAHWDDWKDKWSMVVAVGKEVWIQTPGDFIDNYFTLDNEEGSIPLGIQFFGLYTWMVTIEVDCQRTERAYNVWQLETHAAILQGFLKLDRDYRDELAALAVQAANEVQGRNPLDNQMIERAELKKNTISIFTAQTYDSFGSITFSTQGYPEPWLTKADAEGKYIRFFEQAFEWEHMMYLFYPYFWGRKVNWVNRALLQDVDPEFAEFLKAGSARVVVPVRPGFEAALAHFMDTGEIWEGADPPTLTSPLYVSIIEEIKERTQAPGTEIAQGDPWDVRLPTTLVRLRPDGSLPTWKKQADGTWVPEN
jgi:hypothetical protein